MKLYGAIDLHSNNNVTVLIDEQDEVVYQKRLPNDLGCILDQLSPYASSTLSPSLYRQLGGAVMRWYAHAVSHLRVGPRNRESHRICESYNLGHGVVPTVVWGNSDCQGREMVSERTRLQCLEPDG
jgi:hypothetical protein